MKTKRTFAFIDIKAIFTKHIRAIILASVLGIACALLATVITQPVFEADGFIRISTDKDLISSMTEALGQDINVKQLQGTYAEALKSHLVIDPLVEKVSKEYPVKYGNIDYKNFLKKITITPIKDTQLIKITARSNDPREAENFAEMVMAGFYQTMERYQKASKTSTREFIKKLIEENRKSMDEFAKDLIEFKTKNATLNFNEEYQYFVRNKFDLTNEIAKSKGLTLEYSNKLGNISNTLKNGTRVNIGDNPVLQQYRADLITVEAKIARASVQYTEKYPELQALLAQRADIKKSIADEETMIAEGKAMSTNTLQTTLLQEKFALEANVAGENAKLNYLNDEEKSYDRAMKIFPKLQIEYNLKQEEYLKYFEVNKSLLQKYQEAQISEASAKVDFDVMGKAVAGEQPIAPNATYNLLGGLMIGFVFGISWAFFREVFNPIIRKKEDVAAFFSMPLLAVKKYRESKPRHSSRLLDRINLFNRINRRLRLFHSNEAQQSIEGKVLAQIEKEIDSASVAIISFDTVKNVDFAVDFAEIVAKTGRRTLIVDCDYARSPLDKFYGVKNMGISDILLTDDDPAKYIFRTSIENLFVLPSGVVTNYDSSIGIMSNEKKYQIVYDRISKLVDRIIFLFPRMLTGNEHIPFLRYVGMIIAVTETNCTGVLHANDCLEEIGKLTQCAISTVLFEKD
ncbi:MAG: GNVR domain-containing protein [Bacillota bacterium]